MEIKNAKKQRFISQREGQTKKVKSELITLGLVLDVMACHVPSTKCASFAYYLIF